MNYENLMPVIVLILVNAWSLIASRKYRRVYKQLSTFEFYRTENTISGFVPSVLAQHHQLLDVVNQIDLFRWNVQKDTFVIQKAHLANTWSVLNLVAYYWCRKYRRWCRENIVLDSINI